LKAITAQRRALSTLIALVILTGLLPLALSARGVAAATLPDGFSDTKFAGGFGGRLTQMTFAPDGRLFVSEKQGSVRIVARNGNLVSRPFLTLSTNTDSEHGLKTLAFDPAYATNRYVYVYYTDPNTVLNKVSRFTTSADDPNVADASSEKVLVSGIDSGIYHSGGALAFGSDGKLYISTGDASYAPNAQKLDNLNGKILRLNRDGSVPTDNPFVGQAGKRPEIWAYGLRNPFTFAFNASGRFFINDVGEATWEELNEGRRGANFGWPTCEGVCGDSRFVDPIYSYRHDAGPGKSITGAVFYTGSTFPSTYSGDYFFGDYVGNYIKRYDIETGQVRDFAMNAMFPVDLDVGPDGALYYLSVENRDVHRIAYGGGTGPTPTPTPPPGGSLIGNGGFESGASDWLSPWLGKVRSPAAASIARSTGIVASGNSAARVDIATPAEDWHVQLVQSGIPLTAGMAHTLSFDALASSDRSVRVAFQRNAAPYPVIFERDISIDGAGWNHYSVQFTPSSDEPRALFNFNLGADGGQVWLDNVALTAAPDLGEPPHASISTPAENTHYRAGDVISFSGSATDAEDGSLSASDLRWEVLFHHDTHTHPFVEPYSGATSGTFTVPTIGEVSPNTWYRIHLTATDSDGNSTEVTRDITPLTSDVTLATSPSGLALTLDGIPATAPKTFTGVEGFHREIAAPATQTLGGVSYRFVSWSDGGAATHVISTPTSDQTLTALYERATASANLVTNGGFEKTGSSWLTPWWTNVRRPAQASMTRATGNPAVGSAALKVQIATPDVDWSVQALQPNISLAAGVPHTLTFFARASSARNIRVAFQRNSSPWTTYFERNVSITTSWVKYTVRFTPSVSTSAALFNFNVGARSGTVWIDEVSLTR
jgi:glucose/arabinose dehydrogenase